MPYTPTPYINGAAPAISGPNLRKTEDGLAAATATAENAQATASAATAAATAANATAATAQTTANGKLSQAQADALYAVIAEGHTLAEIRDAAALMLTGGSHTNVTATRVGDVVNLVGSASGGSGATASTDLTDSALLLRTTGSALKAAGTHTYNAGTLVVAADMFSQTAVTGLVSALAAKATTAQLAGGLLVVNNIDGSNPVRPNTATTGQVVLWLYQTGNPPALNGTTAGGAYASVNNVDLHLTFA